MAQISPWLCSSFTRLCLCTGSVREKRLGPDQAAKGAGSAASAGRPPRPPSPALRKLLVPSALDGLQLLRLGERVVLAARVRETRGVLIGAKDANAAADGLGRVLATPARCGGTVRAR